MARIGVLVGIVPAVTDPHMRHVRIDYPTEGLDEGGVPPSPFALFDDWFASAVDSGIQEPNAMTLATVGADGKPSARTMLMKGFDDSGFVFYTNYESRKGRELAANPYAALVFAWLSSFRQIRIEGAVEEVASEESDEYFETRPVGARLGALASRQSEVIPGRAWLADRFEALSVQHPDGDVARPSQWGGYRLVPDEFEFWQGSTNRLHDRIRYRRSDQGWSIDRLSP